MGLLCIFAVVFAADLAVAAVVADYCYGCCYCDVFLTVLNMKVGYDAVYFGKRM